MASGSTTNQSEQIQIIDWMHSNFLFFKFGQTIEHVESCCPIAMHHYEQELWRARTHDGRLLEATQMDDMLLSARQSSAGSASSANRLAGHNSMRHSPKIGLGARQERVAEAAEQLDVGLRIELVDLRTLHEPADKTRHIEVALETSTNRLSLASDDSDLLIGLIQMLVLDRLQLNMNEHLMIERSGDVTKTGTAQNDGVECLLEELGAISESSRQLEESERRIETEIYETSELIKSLMQQLSIANELQEFAIGKQLLAEIAMMLDGTQNSAQAFYLNNRSRLNLMKQANCLREKVLFLTGADGQLQTMAAN